MITFRKKFGSWKLLSNAVKKHLAEMPALADSQAGLERHIELAEALANKQAALKGELQMTVRQRREAEKLGEELRQRLAAAVQSHVGFRTEMLFEFGIEPRRRRRRTESPEPPAAPAAHAPVAPAPSVPPQQ
jgi:hypothetical protein